MPPRQSYEPHQQPQRPAQPHHTPPSVLPQYGYDAVPGQSQRSQHFEPQSPQFQQHSSGHYEVLPTPQPGPNDGHSGHNPYDFIVNPNSNRKRIGLGMSFTGAGALTRVALLGGGIVVVLIVAAVIISSLSPKSSTPGLISIAERQQEIVRVATEAEQQTTTQDGTNFVTNVQVSIASSQTQVVAYLQAHGTKLGQKQLALDQSANTDSQLATAATANDYDSAVAQYMIGQLQNYETMLQTSYQQTSSTSARAFLQADYGGAELLLTQAKNLQNELNN